MLHERRGGKEDAHRTTVHESRLLLETYGAATSVEFGTIGVYDRYHHQHSNEKEDSHTGDPPVVQTADCWNTKRMTRVIQLILELEVWKTQTPPSTQAYFDDRQVGNDEILYRVEPSTAHSEWRSLTRPLCTGPRWSSPGQVQR